MDLRNQSYCTAAALSSSLLKKAKRPAALGCQPLLRFHAIAEKLLLLLAASTSAAVEVTASRAATAPHFGMSHRAAAAHVAVEFCSPAESIVIAMPTLVAIPKSAIVAVSESMIIVAKIAPWLDVNSAAVMEPLEPFVIVKVPVYPAAAAIKLGMAVIEVVPRAGADEYVADEPFRTPVSVRRAGKRIVRVIAVRAYRWIMIETVSRPYLNSNGNLGVRLHRWNRQ